MSYRPLEGFVFAVSPFNFTSIARQPAHRARRSWATPSSGSRRRPRVLGRTSHGACSRRGPADRRHQHRDRLRVRRSASRSRAPARPASISRARPRLPVACGRPWAATSSATGATRASSARPAARTSSSRTRAPTPRRWPWRSPRRLRVPGPEVLGRLARLHPEPLSPAPSRDGAWRDMIKDRHRRASRATSATSSDAVIDGPPIASHGLHRARAQGPLEIRIAGGGKGDKVGLLHRAHGHRDHGPAREAMREEIFGPVLTVYVYDAKDVDGALAPRATRRVALRAHRRGLRARPRAHREGLQGAGATRRATSTSTTSPRARWRNPRSY